MNPSLAGVIAVVVLFVVIIGIIALSRYWGNRYPDTSPRRKHSDSMMSALWFLAWTVTIIGALASLVGYQAARDGSGRGAWLLDHGLSALALGIVMLVAGCIAEASISSREEIQREQWKRTDEYQRRQWPGGWQQ